MTNLELTQENPDVNEALVDLILKDPSIPAEQKDLAWQRIAPRSYFFQMQFGNA